MPSSPSHNAGLNVSFLFSASCWRIPRRACRPHARRRRRLSRVVCQLMGAWLVPRDVVCSFVQVNIPIPGKSARRRRRRARSLLYSFVNTLLICKHVRRDQLHLADLAKQNHLLNQQKSELRPVLGLIGSGSEHIDSSIRAQLPHSTGCRRFVVEVTGKKNR